MINILSDFLVLLLLGMMIVRLKPINLRNDFNKGYLSIEPERCYRGFFAVVVIFHHLSKATHSGILFRGFYYVGYLAVAVFFFFSGYGLQKSYLMKGDKYRKKFIFKRIPTILFPYIVMTLIYWVFHYANGNQYNINGIIRAISIGEPIVYFSWFVPCILSFYVFFWILMCVCRNKYWLLILLSCIWYGAYVLYCIQMKCGVFCYDSVPCIIIGMLWATYEEKILEIVKNNIDIIPLLWLAFVLLLVFKGNIANYYFHHGGELVVNSITAVLFSVCVILFSCRFKIGNKVLSFLGEISFELYMTHGLVMHGLRGNPINIQNDAAWSFCVVAGSVILAYLLHLLFKWMLQGYNRLVERKEVI